MNPCFLFLSFHFRLFTEEVGSAVAAEVDDNLFEYNTRMTWMDDQFMGLTTAYRECHGVFYYTTCDGRIEHTILIRLLVNQILVEVHHSWFRTIKADSIFMSATILEVEG